MNVTNNTKFVLQITPPEVIIFTVNAVNILGRGSENSVTSEFTEIIYMIYKF